MYMTGLGGNYDFKLEWARERPSGDTPFPAPAALGPWGPLNALRALGLKAAARKAPLDFFAVGHAEKIPTEN